jgi:hypothetical protein
MGNMKKEYRLLVGIPEGKRPLEGRRCRCEDNTRIDLKAIDCEVMDWIHLAQDRD